MDLKALLGKLDVLEGSMEKAAKNPTGPKFTGQWKGTDAGTPGKKLVGDSVEPEESILKDLGKGKTPKSKEQELAEEFQAFLEAEFQDTVDKRPARKNARHSRGHEPQPRYKTVKANEGQGGSFYVVAHRRTDGRSAIVKKDGQEQYFDTKEEAGAKVKELNARTASPHVYYTIGQDFNEGIADQVYTVNIVRRSSFGGDSRTRTTSGTLAELLEYFSYTLETGKSYERERGRYKINMNPKNIQSLVDNLNKAKSNAAANGHSSTYYEVGQTELAESHYKWEITFKDGKRAVYHHDSPHYSDATAASDIRSTLKSNPGATVVATKDDQPFDWESLLSEGWESGPEEYKEPHDDADDAYDRMRQEKIDTEAEREWAKLPKVSTYKLTGRGPNMEPNYEFGDEFDSLEQALKYREEIMKDPKTPYPEHIGIRTITRVVNKEPTDEAVQGGGGVKNLEDYVAKRDYIYQQLADPKQKDNYPYFKQALFDLMRVARQQGIKIEESRAHKQLATWFKNRELAQKFASGEVKIPTPQERKAELEKSKKQIKEFGANNVSPYGQPTQDPKQAAQVAQATQTLKSATGATAPTTNIAKAIDSASQGKPVGQQDMKVLEPVMKDVATIAQDPKLAGQFKTLAQQVNQAQLKQQQMAKK